MRGKPKRVLSFVEYTLKEVIDKLREVTLKDQPEAFVYKGAQIESKPLRQAVKVRSFGDCFDVVYPAQRYVLRSELEKVRDLRRLIQRDCKKDILSLTGYLSLDMESSDGGKYTVDICPPIVEYSEEDNEYIPIVCDGMHRIYLAQLEWIDPRAIIIKEAAYPYYAFPNPRGWDDVQLVDSLPEGFLKRWERIEDHKRLYRDFSTAFESHIGGSRGVTTTHDCSLRGCNKKHCVTDVPGC